MTNEIVRGRRNERGVGSTRLVMMKGDVVRNIIVRMIHLMRHHLTPPLLSRIMNVRYYKNMSPNEQHLLELQLVQHLENMVSLTPVILTKRKSKHLLNGGLPK